MRIFVHGFIADLKEFYNHMRISVAPLRWGAGVKGKINSAMKYGVPVVCTGVSTEGMFPQHGENLLIADDPASFAKEVIDVYNNPSLWAKLRAGGFQNVENHFSMDCAVQGMTDMLNAAFRNSNGARRRIDQGRHALQMVDCEGS